ncbi:hypothetical protein GINT2_000572 [Glugoides intestinalis]
MKNYIDELHIEDERINLETSAFYERLGLVTTVDNNVIRICSSRVCLIKSFDGDLILSMASSYFNHLLEEKKIKSLHKNNSELLHDNIGTGVIVISRMSVINVRIGILTSGGDSPGMNSVLRSIVRYSLKNDVKAFGIYRGYDGLVRGDIRELTWDTETQESEQGGTYLLSARSEKFRTREGRKEAAYNLFIRKINALVIIGGNGTMEGAIHLRNEFKSLCIELIAEGKVGKNCKPAINTQMKSDEALKMDKLKDMLLDHGDLSDTDFIDLTSEELYDLKIVGIPGTIDNDIIGTDITLGCDTAMSRITEAVDVLNTTMKSHRRVFVVECMGQRCGWLSLMTGFALEADYILIPEVPSVNWEDEIIMSVETGYYNNKQSIIVIVAEGAVDINGNSIKAKDVEKVISRTGIDVRSIVLGHLQRGGVTSAQDRFLGTIFGMKAVEYILSESTEAVMMGRIDEDFVSLDLMDVVENTKKAEQCFKEKRFDELFKMRPASFQQVYEIYELQRQNLIKRFYSHDLTLNDHLIGELHMIAERKLDSTLCMRKNTFEKMMKPRIGLLVNGTSSAGINSALNSLVQAGLTSDFEVFYIFNGYNGLMEKNARKADIFEFSMFHGKGGVAIGASNCKIDEKDVTKKLKELNIDFLIVIGNANNLKVAHGCNGVFLIPSAIANNVPGTEKSLGSDTALNSILSPSEACRLTSIATNKTVNIIEIGGGNCGYLTMIGGIVCGAFDMIAPETSKVEDIALIRKRIQRALPKQKKSSFMIFRNETTFEGLSTEGLCKLLCKDIGVDYNYSILGNLVRGSVSSILDRINARLSAFEAIEACKRKASSGVIGVSSFKATFTDIEKVLEDYDEEKECPRNPTWMKYSKICFILE